MRNTPLVLVFALFFLAACTKSPEKVEEEKSPQTETTDPEEVVEEVEESPEVPIEEEPRPSSDNETTGPKHVVDHYKNIPQEQLALLESDPQGMRYDLSYENGGWYWSSDYSEEPREADVDLRNGYLRIEDEGTGGGVYSQTFVLYKGAEGEDYLGYTLSEFDGVFHYASHAFYSFYEGEYIDITKEALPTLSANDFLGEACPYTFEEAFEHYQGYSRIMVQFPKKGTTAKAVFLPNQLFAPNKKNPYPDGADQAKLETVLKHLAYESIDLVWDKKKVRFSLGKKNPKTRS